MEIDEKRDLFILTSGVRLYANNNILGIAPDLNTYEGYDGMLLRYGSDLSPEDKKELAQYAVSLWQAFGGLCPS